MARFQLNDFDKLGKTEPIIRLYKRFSSSLGTYFWSFMLNLACVQSTPTHQKKIGKVNCLLARRRFTWGRNDVFKTRCNEQKEPAQTETQLNME